MDLIGNERGRLARLASWLEASHAELAGLGILLSCALVATGLLVWSALGRPGLDVASDGEVTAPHGEAAPGEVASGPATVGDPAGAAGGGAGGGAGDPPSDEVEPTGQEHDGAAPHGHPDTGVTTRAVTVHVAGAVAAPGVVTLPAGARVTDAVAAAGGLTDDADGARINLARPLEDGEQLLVLAVGEEPPEGHVPGGAVTGGQEQGGAQAAAAPGPVDINTATSEQLQVLPGIGPALAGRIVQHREQHGPFRTAGDLRDVSGIGEKRFQDLAPLVTVG